MECKNNDVKADLWVSMGLVITIFLCPDMLLGVQEDLHQKTALNNGKNQRAGSKTQSTLNCTQRLPTTRHPSNDLVRSCIYRHLLLIMYFALYYEQKHKHHTYG